MTRRNSWWVFLIAAAAAAALYMLGIGPLDAGPVFNAIGIASVAAVLAGIWLHRPPATAAWILLAGGLVLFVAGDVLAYNYRSLFDEELPFPSKADGLYLGVYPALVLGLLVLVRRRNPGRDWASLVDSLIVATGLGLLSWTFLMAPYAHDASLDRLSKIVSIGYPMMDALLLMVVVRMAVGRGDRGPSYWLMVGAVSSLLVTDSVYGWTLLHGGYATGGLLDIGWIGFYLLWGAAALHPSMAAVSETTETDGAVTRRRLAIVGLATFLAPITQIVQSLRESSDGSFVAPIGLIVLFTLAILRMVILVKAQEATAGRERTLREAGASLVTATSSQEIVDAAEAASESLAGPGSTAAFHRVVERAGQLHLAPSPRRSDPELPERPLGLPAAVLARLGEHRAAMLDDPSGLVAGAPGKPAVVLPVVSRGELAGLIALADARRDRATIAVLESLALQVGLALESAELTEDLLRAEGEARFRALVQHSSDVVLVLTETLTIRYASPSAVGVLGHDERDLVGTDLATLIEEADRALALSAIGALLTRNAGPSDLVEFRIRHRDGHLVHAESLVSDLLHTPAVAGIVMNLRDITERKEFEKQLAHQAFHDPVTGLANRALFRDRITHALRRRRERGANIALMFFDLDDFKMVNDTLGHLAGDTLLQTIGARLSGALRGGDTAARLGGDEFAVLVEDMPDARAIEIVADRLLDAVRQPVHLDDKELVVQCSMGIALSSDDADEDAEELLRNADIAMYAAKSSGKGHHVTFAPDMRRSVVEKVDLLADLRNAIAGNELHLVYQPIVEIATGRVAGLEALLRWRNPRLGDVTPATFIPLAEESGLIVPLGQWVLDRACRDAVALRSELESPPDWMTVNISAWQLQRPEIVDEVRSALESSGLEPSRLVLEITESMMIKDIDLAIERLTSLRLLGVMIAVDDFGTGYSSLNHIRQLPINTLKIDKSFVERLHEDEHQRKLTATIVELARVLDLKSIAEGVEHAEQLSTLLRLGCVYAQGYHLSHPLRLEALVPRLVAGAGHAVAA